MKGRAFVTVLIVSLLILSAIGGALAQVPKPKDYPTRPIEVVVQYGAGGGSDIFVRSLMMPARAILRVPINVTNLTGGAGVKASTYVLSQPADGYTIYNFSPEQIINTIFGRENYKEFAPLCMVQQDQSIFYVRAESPFKTIQEVIKYAKENPGKLQFTGTTPASPDEVIIMLFAKKAGIKVKYIPFDSAPESHAAVLGGHIDVLHEEPGVIMSLLEAKKLRPLVVFTEKRLEKFPDVPTARELGYDITMGRWRGLAVKKGTPQEIIDYLADVLKRCSQDPNYKAIEKANLLDLRPGWKGPEEFGKFWDEEYVRYKEIFEELGYLKKK
ncbi:MAG: tripartite tricarboxylate transporter substrate binding protein [Desulfobacterota bacterium]|nr:tripartite tricarboxylate transporter substrate binding protein [Thermodesulfobacteriota bacterium]